jgi:hypothetical protein
VSTFVACTIVVSTVPEAVSVRVTGSFEIGMRVEERVIFAGHFAVGFAPAGHALLVLIGVLWAIVEDDITTIVNATAAPIAHCPLLRVVIFPSVCCGSFVLRRQITVAGGVEGGRQRATRCATARRVGVTDESG